METIAWVPPGLESNRTARKLLGVLVPKGIKVGPRNYPAFHEDKRRKLLMQAESPHHLVADLLGLALPDYPRLDPDPEELLNHLEHGPELRWSRAASLVAA